MRSDCDICGGRGIIRLPVQERLPACFLEGNPRTLSIREYACPECSEHIPDEKVLIVQAEEIGDSDYADKEPEYLDYIKGALIHRIANLLVREDQITFSRIINPPEALPRHSFHLRGKLGIISPRAVATFEQRVRQHQTLVAQEVIKMAAFKIDNLRSHYKVPLIGKAMAIQFMQGALMQYEIDNPSTPSDGPGRIILSGEGNGQGGVE